MDSKRRLEIIERYERATEVPLLILAVAIIPLLLLPITVDLRDSLENAFFALDWIIWAVFALDLGLRTYLSERRFNFLLRHWFDVLIVLLPFLRPLRVVRSARVLRISRLAPLGLRVVADLRRLLQRRGLQYVILGGLGAVVGCASLVYLLEKDSGGTIKDYGDALWWAATTVTTVGYGDTFPVTSEGRGVAALLMLVGITFFSWVTANIAAFLVELGDDQEAPVTLVDLMAKLEILEADLRALRDASR